MFLLAFYAFLSIGEFTIKDNDVNNTNLQVSDTQFYYEGRELCGLSGVITSYKHSNLKTIYIPREKSNPNCPVLALESYLDISQHSSGILF